MPRTYYAPYGAQKLSFAAPANSGAGPWPLGSKLVLPDERMFRLALGGSATRVACKLYQGIVPIGAHTEMVVSTVPAIGDKTVAATMGATLAAIDIYSEGMGHFNKATGLDYGHRIRRAIVAGQAHAAAAASAIITVNLEPGESVDVAGISTTEWTLTRNRYHSTIIQDSPNTGCYSGVSVGVVAGSRYYYEQTQGECCVTASGTLVIGDSCVGSATTDGTAMPSAAQETDGPVIGWVMNLNITAESAMIFLKLD